MKFIPKVGEECLLLLDYTLDASDDRVDEVWQKVLITSEYKDGYVAVWQDEKSGFINTHFGDCGQFKPIKTPAEIEREELKDWLNDDSYIYQMTDTLLIDNICNHLILGGYRKQQVKPLSFDDYYLIRSTNSLQQSYRKLTECGFIIQGGDK